MSEAGPPAWEPFDPDDLRSVVEEVFSPITDHWFRPRLLGAHRLPRNGPLILAANHSGSAFPYDGIVLDSLLWRRDGFRPEAKFRSVYEKKLSLHWWMRPFGIDDFWRRAGGVDLTFDNFDRLLARGERIAYYPEGVPGIGKGFPRRYQLQRFSTSFVILAARHRAPVYPVHIVNAEWVIPFNFTLPPLDRLVMRLFGVPFLPLPGAVFAFLFPWAWYLATPARMVFVVGEPIDVAAMVRETGETDLMNPDRRRMREVADRIRDIMQADLRRHVARYGRWPYQVRSLGRSLLEARRKRILARVLPTGWAFTFNRRERNRHRPDRPARGIRAALRDWDLIGFYLPLGWPLLSIARALRKPPCGYRGLSRAQRLEREGRFVWNLVERPLPPVSRAREAAGRAESESGTGRPRPETGHSS